MFVFRQICVGGVVVDRKADGFAAINVDPRLFIMWILGVAIALDQCVSIQRCLDAS